MSKQAAPDYEPTLRDGNGVSVRKKPMPLVILPAPVPARPRRFSAAVLFKIYFLTTPSGRTTFP